MREGGRPSGFGWRLPASLCTLDNGFGPGRERSAAFRRIQAHMKPGKGLNVLHSRFGRDDGFLAGASWLGELAATREEGPRVATRLAAVERRCQDTLFLSELRSGRGAEKVCGGQPGGPIESRAKPSLGWLAENFAQRCLRSSFGEGPVLCFLPPPPLCSPTCPLPFRWLV